MSGWLIIGWIVAVALALRWAAKIEEDDNDR